MTTMAIRVNARGRKRIPGTPIVLNFGARSGVSWSLKVGRFTYSPKARRLSINTPGIGSVQITPGRTRSQVAQPEHVAGAPDRRNVPVRRYPPVAELRADADLVAFALARVACRSCGAELGDVCRTATKRTPTEVHRWRLEDAWDRIAVDRTPPSGRPRSGWSALWPLLAAFGLVVLLALFGRDVPLLETLW